MTIYLVYESVNGGDKLVKGFVLEKKAEEYITLMESNRYYYEPYELED